ncbi:hypothetical protein BDR04DRAFT_821926 [Suillus decipiens]|nr:hypothetical protein BDR04DRAFT_821926 [Suillus decipiens]
MEYSADEIAAAWNFQFLAYVCMSTATFWTYDFVCSLHEEWTFLLRSRWTKVKGLYIITRYIPFALIIMDLCLALAQKENPEKCLVLSNIFVSFEAISLACSEIFFILRTYALWNNNKIVLVAMLSALSSSYHLSAYCLSPVPTLMSRLVPSQASQAALGAHTVSYYSYLLFWCLCFNWVCSRELGAYIVDLTRRLTLSPGLVFLTMIRVIQNWRSAKGPLYVMLVRHNIFYYACGLRESDLQYVSTLISDDSFQKFSRP